MRSLACMLLAACSVQDITFYEPGTGGGGGDGGGSNGPDETAPTIESRVPDVDAANVQPATAFSVTFDEPIAADATLTVTDSKGAVEGSVTITDRTLAFVPTKLLRNPDHFTVTLGNVRDAAGNAMADTTWAFDTRPKAWQTPKLLENLDSGGVENGDLVVSPDGSAVVVFVIANGGNQDLHSTSYSPMTGWTAPEPVENMGGRSVLPRMCADAGGNALVVWRQEESGQTRMYSSRRTAGVWDTPRRIENRSGAAVNEVFVGCRPDGKALAVWRESSTSTVVSAHFTGSAWEANQTVPSVSMLRSLATPTSAFNQEVYYAPWVDTSSQPHRVRSAQWLNGTWTTLDLVSDANGLYDAVARGLNDGSVVTAYTRMNSGGLWSVRGSFGSPIAVDAQATSIPSLAAGVGATAAVAYSVSPSFTIRVKRWNGSAWSAESAPLSGIRIPTDSALAPDGTLHVAYLTTIGSLQQALVITQSASGAWSPAVPLGDPAFNSFAVRVATDTDGNATMIYLADNGVRRDLYGVQYH